MTSDQSSAERLARLPFDSADVAEAVNLMSDHGYVIVNDILNPDEVAATRRELRTLLGPNGFEATRFLGRRTKRLYSVPARTRSCDGMLIHPFVCAVLDTLLKHYLLSSTTVTDIYPGEQAQTLHTDDSSWPTELISVVGDIQVGVLWALDNFTTENGATRLVPGSQLWPTDARRAPVSEYTVPAVMNAGSALIYSGRLVHSGGANVSAHRRLGLVLTYVRSWLRQQENFMATCGPGVAAGFPPRLRELVGYDVYPPLLGHINGRHPAEYLGHGPTKLSPPPR